MVEETVRACVEAGGWGLGEGQRTYGLSVYRQIIAPM